MKNRNKLSPTMVEYEAKIGGKLRTIIDPSIVDMMDVSGKLRWADEHGERDVLEEGNIVGVTGGGPWKVVVKSGSGRQQLYNRGFARQKNEQVYVAGSGSIDRIEGELIRVRRQLI